MLSGLCSDLWILSCKNPIPCKSSFWKEAGSPAMKLSRRSPPSSLAVAIKFPLMPKCSRFNVSSRQALTRFSTNYDKLRLISLAVYPNSVLLEHVHNETYKWYLHWDFAKTFHERWFRFRSFRHQNVPSVYLLPQWRALHEEWSNRTF